MANIAAILKSEISRIARKEGRSEIESLRQIVAAHRSELAALRKKMAELERTLKQLSNASVKAARVNPNPSHSVEHGGPLRFRAAGMAANRKRLDLSAGDFGRLVGATARAIYSWEAGKSKPTRHQLESIASLRGVGKREVVNRLKQLSPK